MAAVMQLFSHEPQLRKSCFQVLVFIATHGRMLSRQALTGKLKLRQTLSYIAVVACTAHDQTHADDLQQFQLAA